MVIDFSYEDIINQCNSMVYLNVLSYCLLSGCGNIDLPHENELNKIYSICKNARNEKIPENIFFMSSLYKKCTPIYEKTPLSPYDYSCFQWTHKNMKKELSPDVMAYSIQCMSSLVKKINNNEILTENKDFISYCLLNSAIKQAMFLKQNLKLGDYYTKGKDMSDTPYSEYHIELNPDDIKLSDQFLVLEGISLLLKTLEESDIRDSNVCSMLKAEFTILPTLIQNLTNNIGMIKSRELSVICMSLYNIYTYFNDYKEILYNALNNIGCELHERVYENGDIARNYIDAENSSFITLSNCLKCFIMLSNINRLDIYENKIKKIYSRFNSFWNESTGLFSVPDNNKINYSIKDIGYIIETLKAVREHFSNSDLNIYAEKQLINFYRSSIVNSKIFNNQLYPILQNDKHEMSNLGSTNKNYAPVFGLEFDMKINKRKYDCKTDIYKPEYVLCCCKHLL